MEPNRRLGDSPDDTFTRSDRFIVEQQEHYYRTREGVMGPFDDLSSALLGLVENAKKAGMPQYQINQLYQSVCKKVLESC
ncbi:DUF6316 family protein [Aliikangiella sp. IMCC44359]|uniref:DUF6316 family protein n=1 Tax=Aliikangiella sp. IMCC44359 TaxID=3459125 RepID=UPI00403A8CB1